MAASIVWLPSLRKITDTCIRKRKTNTPQILCLLNIILQLQQLASEDFRTLCKQLWDPITRLLGERGFEKIKPMQGDPASHGGWRENETLKAVSILLFQLSHLGKICILLPYSFQIHTPKNLKYEMKCLLSPAKNPRTHKYTRIT